jgi:SNF2 family DNA or RNA helicase
MVTILRVRQLLVCPKILGIDDIGAGLEAVIEQTEQELLEDNSVIIFTPFTDAIPFIKEELEKLNEPPEIFIIHGGFTVEQYDQIQNAFQDLPTKNKVMICSIKSGASITLTEANICIFLGYERSATDNDQAEKRSARKGQTQLVRCMYVLYENSPDEDIIRGLNDKQLSIDVCINPLKYYKKIVDNNS